MQPTQQGLVPVNFFRGKFPLGTYVKAINASFDHVITAINFNANDASGQPVIVIRDQAGNDFMLLRANPSVLANPPILALDLFVVLHGLTGLQLVVLGDAVTGSIDGYSIAPPAGGLLPSSP